MVKERDRTTLRLLVSERLRSGPSIRLLVQLAPFLLADLQAVNSSVATMPAQLGVDMIVWMDAPVGAEAEREHGGTSLRTQGC